MHTLNISDGSTFNQKRLLGANLSIKVEDNNRVAN